MNNNESKSIMSYVCKILEKYVSFMNSMGFKQGSTEWLNNRVYSIGCSELYKACGTPTKQQEIVNIKSGKGPNLSTIIPVIWGTVFESSTRTITELILGTKIFTLNGSIRNKNSVISCSPDGIGIVRLPKQTALDLITKDINDYYTISKDQYKFKCNKLIEPGILCEFGNTASNNWEPPQDDDDVELIALYEFKSRHSKALVHDKIQPEHLYQVLGGIEVMKIVYNIGVYAESWFKLGDFTNEKTVITDPQRRQQGVIYFGSCKYVFLTGVSNLVMQDLDLRGLSNKRVTEDYNILDGPYIFQYKDIVVFDDNGFFDVYPELKDIPRPSEIAMINVYFKQINDALNKLPNKPTYFANYQLQQLSIKYVSGLKGFLDLLDPICREVLSRV